MRFLFTALLFSFSVTVFGQPCNSYFTGQFEPAIQNQQDSVYYLFTLSGMYELHTTKAYRTTYNIRWYDHCVFQMESKTSSKPAPSDFKPQLTFTCTAKAINKEEFDLNINGKSLRLKNYNKQSLWELMSQRDHELIAANKESEKMLEEYKSKLTSTDSVAGMGMIDKLKKLLYEGSDVTPYQLKAIDLFFNDLKTFDFSDFYTNSSATFKKQITGPELKNYFSYIEQVYGRWEYFSVLSQSLNSNLFDSSNVEKGISKYTFLVKFENAQKEVKVDLALDNTKYTLKQASETSSEFYIQEQEKTFQYISIAPNEFDSSAVFQKMSAHFLENFYAGNFFNIYNESSSIFKAIASFEQTSDMLRLALSMSEGKYSFYQHAFSLDKQHGGIISIYYISKAKKGRILMTLTYLMDVAKPQLIGINFNEIQ